MSVLVGLMKGYEYTYIGGIGLGISPYTLLSQFVARLSTIILTISDLVVERVTKKVGIPDKGRLLVRWKEVHKISAHCLVSDSN